MNFTESFQEFAGRLGPTDIALYGGAGIILWILFKDQLVTLPKIIMDFVNKVKNHQKIIPPITSPINNDIIVDSNIDGLFFDLVVSWKQTRDLAHKSGCLKAVEIIDSAFPHLGPNNCLSTEDKE